MYPHTPFLPSGSGLYSRRINHRTRALLLQLPLQLINLCIQSFVRFLVTSLAGRRGESSPPPEGLTRLLLQSYGRNGEEEEEHRL
jgi:hypothetical protein